LIRSRSGALIAGLAFSTIATGVLLISVPLELRQMHATPEETGVTLSMFGFGMFAFEWVWGLIADRRGYRSPLIVSLVLYAACIVLLAAARTVPLIAITYFLGCGMMVAVGPVARSYLGTSLHVRLRATGLGLLSSQWTIAEAIGAGAGGWLIDRFPIQTVILGAAILPLISAVLCVWAFRGYSHAEQMRRRTGEDRRVADARAGSSIAMVIALTASIALLVQIGLGGEGAFLPLLVTGRLHLSASSAGAALLAVGLVGGLLLVPGGAASDRWGRKPTMVAGGVVSAGGFVVYAVAGSFPAVLAGAVLRAAGSSLLWPAATAWISESVPRRRHALFMGLFGEFENIGVTLGPAVGGLVWAGFGIQSAFFVYAVAALAASVIALVAVRSGKREQGDAELSQDLVDAVSTAGAQRGEAR
jgi:MFS transporter, DHA1 family, multidrug resistance protein